MGQVVEFLFGDLERVYLLYNWNRNYEMIRDSSAMGNLFFLSLGVSGGMLILSLIALGRSFNESRRSKNTLTVLLATPPFLFSALAGWSTVKNPEWFWASLLGLTFIAASTSLLRCLLHKRS